MTTLGWDTESEQMLRRLFEAGLSFRDIAGKLGVSRNAALGKAYRLGLGERENVLKGRPRKDDGKERTRRNAHKPAKFALVNIGLTVAGKPVEQAVRVADVDPLRIDLLQLTPLSCRYPYGGNGKPITFCGHVAIAQPYCAAHAVLCYNEGAR